MEVLKKIFNDIKNRIFENPKSTVAAIIAAIAYLASAYGFEVSPEILAAISTILLVLIGLFIKD